jgi:predicted nuclease of predicted toxin-antitoxin system
MPWKRLPDAGKLPNEFKRKSRFLVDEGLGNEVAEYLREQGYSTLFVGDVGLLGHSDEDVFAYAWRERRVLLTHDHDFMSDEKFPEHRNPGVIVLAGGGGDDQALGTAIATVIIVFGSAPGVWEKSKITISADGHMTIRNRDFDTGRVKTTRYRRSGRNYEAFEDDV